MLNSLERAILSPGELVGGITLLKYYDRLILHWDATMVAYSSTDPQALVSESAHMASLAEHCSLLALNLLSVESPPSHALVLAILAHLTAISKVFSRVQLLPPSPLIIYLLMFASPNLHALSIVCAILTTHRYSFEHGNQQATQSMALRGRDQINALNGMLMDTANLLWRSRAFNATDSNAQACLLTRPVFSALQSYASNVPVPSQNISALFGLSSHPLVSGLAIAAFRQVEDSAITEGADITMRHAGPITQRSLVTLERNGGVKGVDWKGYRISVLDWLFNTGLTGVQGLMGSTMKGIGLGRDRNQQFSNGSV